MSEQRTGTASKESIHLKARCNETGPRPQADTGRDTAQNLSLGAGIQRQGSLCSLPGATSGFRAKSSFRAWGFELKSVHFPNPPPLSICWVFSQLQISIKGNLTAWPMPPICWTENNNILHVPVFYTRQNAFIFFPSCRPQVCSVRKKGNSSIDQWAPSSLL